MFPGAVEAEEPMAGSCSVAPAGTDQLDLEAAEQLIQLSGGDGAADADDAGSESRTADSVKCRRKKKEAAVESRRRRSAGRIPAAAGKDGNGGGGSEDIKGVDDSVACSATAADDVVAKDQVVAVQSCRSRRSAARFPAGKEKDRDGGIVHGEARKRPRFRLLADIYKDTEPRRLPAPAGGGERHADRDPPEDERKKEKKRAADGVIAADAQRRARQEDLCN